MSGNGSPPSRAVLFDAYGTLFNIHAPVDAIENQIGVSAQSLSALWRQKQIQYTWLRSLMKSYADFWEITKDALDHSLEHHKINNPELRNNLLNQYEKIAPYEDAKMALESLKSRAIVTGILSNGSHKMLQSAIDRASFGNLLDHLLSAESVRIFKPARDVYALGEEATGLAASDISFVSANAWDVAGASYYGYRVFWVNRFGQTGERLPMGHVTEVESLASLAAYL